MKLNINGKQIEVSDEDLSKALEDKTDFELKSDDLVIRSTEEENSYKENIRKEGLTAGTEIGRKNLIKELGIEGEGLHKSDESAKTAIESWANGLVEEKTKDLNKEPTAKIKELKNDIETLKGTITSLTTEKETLSSQLTDTKNGYEKRQLLMNAIPDNTVLPKEDLLPLIDGNVNLKKTDRGEWAGIGADGQPIKDPNTLNIVPVKDVIGNFFNDNPQYLKKAEGGAGGKDSGGDGGKQSLDSFTKEMQEKGVQINGAEFNQEMTARIKAGTLEV